MDRGLLRGATALVVAIILSCATVVMAQSRAELIEQQQAEKAKTVHAPEPSRAERFFEQFEEGKWFVGAPRGWYPYFGSIYPSGGIAGGAGYRHHIGYDSYVDAAAMISVNNYKKVQIVGSTPNHLHRRLDLGGTIAWLDATQVPFYGLGKDSSRADRTVFGLRRTQMEGSASFRLVDWLRLRIDGGLDDYDQRAGRGNSPSIEERFSPLSAPRLGEDELFLRGEVSATALWLQSPGYSRRGGLYRFAYEEFNPLRGSGGTFGFVRTEIVQHVPILRETWVFSARARTESIARKSDVVPYYLMPWLGSGNTLRAYPTGRFRDRHTLLLGGELRWFPNRTGLDMALFYDAGTVAPFRSHLVLDRLKSDYGIGVRFHTPSTTALRIDLARGHEGWRTVVAASAPF